MPSRASKALIYPDFDILLLLQTMEKHSVKLVSCMDCVFFDYMHSSLPFKETNYLHLNFHLAAFHISEEQAMKHLPIS